MRLRRPTVSMTTRDDLRVRGDLVIQAEELRELATRSSGPGGQHVNKTSTRVTIRWSVVESPSLTASQRTRLLSRLAKRITRRGDLVVHADQSRSRSRNREQARERLAEIVREALKLRRARKPTAPSKAARRRRTDAKTHRAGLKRTRGSVDPDSE
jgi:ribosome-associated protein